MSAIEAVKIESVITAASLKRPLLHLWLWQEQQAQQQPDKGNWLKRIWADYINYEVAIGGSIKFTVASLAIGIGLLLIALVLSRTLQRFLEKRLSTRTHIDPGIQYTILRLTHYIIIVVGVLFAARVSLGLDITSIAFLFTALSVGIGFGLQFIAGDIASGFILLFERPVRIGDFVTIAGPDSKTTEGRVQSINLRTTVVQTNDHISVIVPNSKLVNQNLINWSYGGRRSRISIPVGVSYDADVNHVTETLLRAAEGVEFILTDPKPSVQFLGFGDYSLDFRLLVWTDRPRRYPKIKSDINYRIRKLFLEEEIEIPFPRQDLNLLGGALKLESKNARAILRDGERMEDDEREESFTAR